MKAKNRLNPQKRLLNISSVARRLSLSKSFVYQLIQRNELPSIHIGRSVRVLEEDLHNFIEMNKQ